GPAIENGFYYDIDFGAEKISDADLPKLEASMRKHLSEWKNFTSQEVSKDAAMAAFSTPAGANPYKTELIGEIEGRGEKITLYSCGGFTDLCRGGHAEHPSEDIAPDSFALDRVAGAYWRGDEKNPMLTRIYGLAFDTKEELDAYKAQREEAKKRDHRKLGKELELFTIIDEIGPGLPLFYPKGALLRRTIENYITDLQESRGYVPIWIPHITKGELYEISGHLQKYDAMYSPMKVDEEDYYLKPMNCPHFMMLYRTLPHSYRQLPLRYTSTTTNYRYEKSGELSGLTRVRALTQDDCHVFCTPEQIEGEITLMTEMIGEVYRTFGFEDFWVRISLRDSKNKEGYLGGDAVWNTAEDALRTVMKKTGWQYQEVENEAAFYGPKLDFMLKDALGREWQLSTIQLDFNLPKRFELEYTDMEGKKAQPVVIHRAILGSTERFMGIMIEHYAGAFPLWLSPVQARVLPVSEKHAAYAQEVLSALKAANIRADVGEANESLGKKIRAAKTEKIPYLLVVGDKEVESKTVSIDSRDHGKIDALPLTDFIARATEEIKTRK
ncbi:MAG: threonyl-tRNA synthetase, partial [Parcubacteria group bacterium Gr01-1014_49]